MPQLIDWSGSGAAQLYKQKIEENVKKRTTAEAFGPPPPPADYQPPEPAKSLFSVPFSVLDMPGEQPMPIEEKPLEQAQQWKQQN